MWDKSTHNVSMQNTQAKYCKPYMQMHSQVTYHQSIAGIVTRTPVELRMHHQHEGKWRGGIFCQNDDGEQMKVALDSPSEVHEAIRKGKL